MREDQKIELQHPVPDARPVLYIKASNNFQFKNEEEQKLVQRLVLYGALMGFLLVGIPAILFFFRDRIETVNNPSSSGTAYNTYANTKQFSDENYSFSFSYPASWEQSVGDGQDGGCNIIFTRPHDASFWVSICGLYVNPAESIDNLARFHSASGIALVREEQGIGTRRSIRQEVVVSNDTDYSYTLSYFIADVPSKSIGTEGIVAIHMRITDRLKVDALKKEFNTIINTLMIDEIANPNMSINDAANNSTTLPTAEDSALEPPIVY